MGDFDFTIKAGSGKFNKLDKLYRDYVINSIKNNNESGVFRWEVYNIIMNELINIGRYDSFEEVKYRITGGENPNEVMLEMFGRFLESNHLMWIMKGEIENFMEEDIINRFL